MLLNRAPKSRYPLYPATATPPNNVICCAFPPISITPIQTPSLHTHLQYTSPFPTYAIGFNWPSWPFEYIRSQFDDVNGMHFSVPL